MVFNKDGVQVNCKTKEGAVFCQVKKGDKKGEFGIGINENGNPQLKSPKGDLRLIKDVKDDVASIVKVRGVEGAVERF